MGSTLQGTQNSFLFVVSPSKTYNFRSCILVSQVLCVEDGEFKPYPTSLALPAKAGPHTVILLGIPQSVGPLKITGKYCILYSRKCILLQKHTFIQVFLLSFIQDHFCQPHFQCLSFSYPLAGARRGNLGTTMLFS